MIFSGYNRSMFLQGFVGFMDVTATMENQMEIKRNQTTLELRRSYKD